MDKKSKTLLKSVKAKEAAYRRSTAGQAVTERAKISIFIIKKLEELGMTKKDFCKKVGITLCQLNKFIQCDNNWQHNVYFRIKNGLGCKSHKPFPF